MSAITLKDLRASVLDRAAFTQLDDYRQLCTAFLGYLAAAAPTRIVSPTQPEYIFYQYGDADAHRITRPLNSSLFLTENNTFAPAFDRFTAFLHDLKRQQEQANAGQAAQEYLATNDINRIVYTLQQSIGCIADSFPDSIRPASASGSCLRRSSNC